MYVNHALKNFKAALNVMLMLLNVQLVDQVSFCKGKIVNLALKDVLTVRKQRLESNVQGVR